jgi:hypothetical protein
MRQPFAFWKPATSAGIDPATLAATLYLRNFGGLPWAGTASAGTSASQSFVTSGADPSVGASFGAHASADFSGGQYIGAFGFDWSTLIGTGSFTLQFVAQFDTFIAPVGAGSEYLDPALLAGVSFGGIYVRVTSSGLAAGFYDGSGYVDTATSGSGYVALAASTKACIQVVYDGSTLKMRVNGGSYKSTSAATPPAAGALSDTPIMGASYAASGSIDGRIAQALAFASALSGATLDGLYLDAQLNYGVP